MQMSFGGKATAVPRLAIVGNSFVGAIIKARQDRPDLASRAEIEFVTRAGYGFSEIDAQAGAIVNGVRLGSNEPLELDTVDAVIVYGVFTTPRAAADIYVRLAKQGYSTQVRNAAVRDAVLASPGYILRDRIQAQTNAPVYLLSSNISSNSKPVSAVRYETGVNLLRDQLGDSYISFPAELFGEGVVPKLDYYKGSVRKDGTACDVEVQSHHDINHMNPAGGALVLTTILDHIEKHLVMSGDTQR